MYLSNLSNYSKQRKILLTISMSLASFSLTTLVFLGFNDYQSKQSYILLNSLYTTVSQETSQSTDQTDYNFTSQFRSFGEINNDFVAWLSVGDFSTPVVQTTNNVKYLTTDFYGQPSQHGTVFADFRNSFFQLDNNIILYGHNYNISQHIFYQVERYKDPNFATQFPIITLDCLNGPLEFVVFAFFTCDADPYATDYFDYHNYINFDSNAHRENFLQQVAERNFYMTDIETDVTDSFITLSTCGYEFSTQRYVLLARKVSDGETVYPIYTKNPSPKMPLVWQKLYN